MNPVLIDKFVSLYGKALEIAGKKSQELGLNGYILQLQSITDHGFYYQAEDEGMIYGAFTVFWNELCEN